MERERTPVRQGGSGSGPESDGDALDTVLAREILDAADRILDSIRPVNAQQYLEQNQQRAGE